MEAREKSANLEYEIYMRIREEAGKYILAGLSTNAGNCRCPAELCCGGKLAHLVRPVFTAGACR